MQSDSIIIEYKEAVRLGLGKYFTGRPCHRGHIALRNTATQQCAECAKINRAGHDRLKRLAGKKRWYDKHKPTVLAQQAEYYKANRSAIQEKQKQRHVKQREQDNARTRKWLANNKTRKAVSDREYRRANKDDIATWHATHYKQNSEQIKARSNLWYQQNRERAIARIRAYYKAHPEQYRAYRRNQKAKRAAAPGHHSAADIRAIWIRQNKRCIVPGCTHPIAEAGRNRFHVDHIIAIANNGTNWANNLQILCPHHNMQKKAGDDIEWAQRELGTLFVL